MDLEKKIVLVTGASRGIGAETAKLLATQGYAVVVNYRNNQQAADSVYQSIIKAGGECITVQADVSNEQEVISLFEKIDYQLGPVTHLVNNIGILLPQMSVLDMDAARINKVLTTNITSYFLCSKEAIRRMKNGGAIVNVSSAASRTGSPNEYVDYAASKGAIDTFTKGLALEVASLGIRVNCVRPGIIYTDIHKDGGEPNRVDRLREKVPMQRGGQALEVAQAIAWLLSDQASFTTGSYTDVTGGL